MTSACFPGRSDPISESRPHASAPLMVPQATASRAVHVSVRGMAPDWLTTSLSTNLWYASASRIWVNRSPEFSETMSQLSVGLIPNSRHLPKASRPIPMLSSVSGEIDTLAPASASTRQSASSSVLQCTCT